MFDTRMVEEIPEGLDRMEPGPFPAAILSTVDISRLSDHDRIIVLRAQKRMAVRHEAKSYQSMAAAASPESEDRLEDIGFAFEATAMELQAGLRLTRRAADTELSLAVDLARRLPRVLDAMSSGVVDKPRVRVMVNETSNLSVGTARDVIDQVIEKAPRLTTGQLRALLRKLCTETNPEQAQERFDEAISKRCLHAEPTEFGTTDLLLLNISPDKAAAATDHINHLAKHHKHDGETRTIEQLRADIATDLLCGNPTAAPTRRGVVDLHVDLKTLTELAQTPGELAGYGPVIADIARQVTQQQSDT